MKQALTFSLAAILALPLIAEEPKSAPKTAETTASQAQPATVDSPLVQASKRSGRRGGKSKSILITNDSLKASKGHVTTSHSALAPLNIPEPKLGPEAELAAAKAQREYAQKQLEEQKKEAARKAAEHRAKVRAAASTQAEDGLYESLDGDPAEAERAAGTTDAPPSGSKPPVE